MLRISTTESNIHGNAITQIKDAEEADKTNFEVKYYGSRKI